MIDNFEKIRDLLVFESDDDFYYLQILQRKKENPELGSNSRVIKNYYIRSVDYLDKKKEEIINLCNQFNARASIRLNRRSFIKVAFKTQINISNQMMNRDFLNVSKAYDRACGQSSNEDKKNKKWIIDVDEEFSESLFNIIEGFTIGVNPNINQSKVVTTIPSKSGFHVITTPFDLRNWKSHLPNLDIHKDNPTNLYIP